MLLVTQSYWTLLDTQGASFQHKDAILPVWDNIKLLSYQQRDFHYKIRQSHNRHISNCKEVKRNEATANEFFHEYYQMFVKYPHWDVNLISWGPVKYCRASEKTTTTRTPAFWAYPPLPCDNPYYWFILDPKSKQNQVKATNFNNLPKVQIF